MKKDSCEREYLTVGKKWLDELLGHCVVKAGEKQMGAQKCRVWKVLN